MKKKMLTSLAAAAMLTAGTAQAEGAQAGDLSFFLSNVFGNSPTLTGGQGGEIQPTYNLGYMITDNLMPYGGFAQQNWGGGTATSLRGGARFYLMEREAVRLFADSELQFVLSNVDNGDSLGLAANVGAEYNFTRNFGIAGRVGLRVTDNDNNTPTGGNSQVTLGAADVVLNFYF